MAVSCCGSVSSGCAVVPSAVVNTGASAEEITQLVAEVADTLSGMMNSGVLTVLPPCASMFAVTTTAAIATTQTEPANIHVFFKKITCLMM